MFPALSKCDGWLFFHFSFSFFVSPELEDLVSKCERHQDTICRCKKGYYKFNIDSVAYDCRKCQSCDQDEIEKQKCTYSNGRCNKSPLHKYFVYYFWATFNCFCCCPMLLTGTPETNAVCECKENFHRVNKKCELCTK